MGAAPAVPGRPTGLQVNPCGGHLPEPEANGVAYLRIPLNYFRETHPATRGRLYMIKGVVTRYPQAAVGPKRDARRGRRAWAEGQYSSASMIVSTRLVTAGSGEP